jgi:hypothetical protein
MVMVTVMVMIESQQDEGVERLVKELLWIQSSPDSGTKYHGFGGRELGSICLCHSLSYIQDLCPASFLTP